MKMWAKSLENRGVLLSNELLMASLNAGETDGVANRLNSLKTINTRT